KPVPTEQSTAGPPAETIATPEPTETPSPTDEPTATFDGEQTENDEPATPIGWMLMTALLAGGCGIMYYFLRKARKENKSV
ncbi:MAG: hypothetical protein LBD85_06500, partial [Oscillospiraceae bacterium]|nr:hypothetical protein [Oscillospiraceae bacterium]